MALDSDLKRGSAMLPGIPWRPFVSIPDSIDQADRQTVAHYYSGILAGGVQAPEVAHGDSFGGKGAIGRSSSLGRASRLKPRSRGKFLV